MLKQIFSYLVFFVKFFIFYFKFFFSIQFNKTSNHNYLADLAGLCYLKLTNALLPNFTFSFALKLARNLRAMSAKNLYIKQNTNKQTAIQTNSHNTYISTTLYKDKKINIFVIVGFRRLR